MEYVNNENTYNFKKSNLTGVISHFNSKIIKAQLKNNYNKKNLFQKFIS